MQVSGIQIKTSQPWRPDGCRWVCGAAGPRRTQTWIQGGFAFGPLHARRGVECLGLGGQCPALASPPGHDRPSGQRETGERSLLLQWSVCSDESPVVLQCVQSACHRPHVCGGPSLEQSPGTMASCSSDGDGSGCMVAQWCAWMGHPVKGSPCCVRWEETPCRSSMCGLPGVPEETPGGSGGFPRKATTARTGLRAAPRPLWACVCVKGEALSGVGGPPTRPPRSSTEHWAMVRVTPVWIAVPRGKQQQRERGRCGEGPPEPDPPPSETQQVPCALAERLNLVDPASSHMLRSRTKPCMSQRTRLPTVGL